MVGMYNKNTGPENAVPVEKIMSITTDYQQGMKQANQEYTDLSSELKKEQN